jgi:hypothetical protein
MVICAREIFLTPPCFNKKKPVKSLAFPFLYFF